MKRLSFIPFGVLTVVAGLLAGCQSSANFPYKNSKLSAEERVKDLLSRMSLEEKVDMLAGAGWMETKANARLGIPSIKMADGPMGVRSWAGSSAITNTQPTPVLSTSFPSSAAMGAAWNPELVEQEGKAIAQQTKAHGRDMILAPTVNINRIPLWGRNFEGYGEDPYLAARMGVAYIKGVQGEGVIPSLKHFAANNEEFERHRIDEKIDERTLNEIYLPAFKAGVLEGGVWAVMSAYNKVNGVYCAENPYLLKDTLKNLWGFKGFVISDWGSTYSTAATVNAGMDLEMPGGEPMKRWFAQAKTKESGNGAGWLTPDKVLPEVKAGKISTATIDDNVGRMLRVMFLAGLFEKPHTAAPDGKVQTPEHKAVALTAATQGIVLLKNQGGVLPLDSSKIKSVAVIGPAAAVAYTGGGGSSLVRPVDPVAPLDGIRQRAGSGVQVSYALGVSMEGEDAAKDTPAEQAKLREEAVAAAAKADVGRPMRSTASSRPWAGSEAACSRPTCKWFGTAAWRRSGGPRFRPTRPSDPRCRRTWEPRSRSCSGTWPWRGFHRSANRTSRPTIGSPPWPPGRSEAGRRW